MSVHFSGNSPVRRVFVLRPDHLGDVILFSGCLRHLKRRWPEAELVFCGQEYACSLLEHCPHIARFVPFKQLDNDALCRNLVSRLPGVGLDGRVAQLIRAVCRPLRQPRYACDVVLMPLRSPDYLYHVLVDYIPAGAKYGVSPLRTARARSDQDDSPSYYTAQLPTSALPADFPELELNRKFLEFVGCNLDGGDVWPEFWTAPEDVRFARDNLKAPGPGLIIGIAPGVQSWTDKQMPPEWYREVFQNLPNIPCHVRMFGTRSEDAHCQAVMNLLGTLPGVRSVGSLAGRTTARQLVECIRRCDVVLSQETAALHMAVALKIPAAGIVGGGHFNRFFPWGTPGRVHPIFNKLDCFGCDWQCTRKSLLCLNEIRPADAARQLGAALLQAEGRLP